MKKFISFLLVLALTSPVWCQNTFRRNTVYGELAGNGIFLSLNYERQLASKPGFGVRLGVGHASANDKLGVTIPVGINYLVNLNSDKSYIHLGIGGTWSQAALVKAFTGLEDNSYTVSLVPSIGYRHQAKWGLMWHIGFAPIISRYRFIPYPAFSLGASF